MKMNVLQFAPNSITYIGQQFGNYRIVKLLGQGGSAAVYLAIHRYLNTQAAVKILHTQPGGAERQRFLIEARISAQLVHPHVVRVLEFGLQDGVTFLVMEYAPNGSLRQLHLREQTLSSKVVLHYARQIADGLQYIHRRGLIHQNVKPENLLVGHNYQILLSDFGIAITANKPNAFYKRTIVGTAAYMAPEQIQGNSCFASDQYALATTVYEWLCGDVPFQGSWLGIAQQQLYSAPPSLREKVSTIPPTVERVIVRALAKKPEQRFRSVQEFVAALEQTSIERFSVSYSIPEPGSACRYLLKVEEKPATSQLLSIRN